MSVRRLFTLLLLVVSLGSTAWSQSSKFVVQVLPGTNINTVAAALGGSVLDSASNGTYLISSASQTLPNTLPSGTVYAESNIGLNSGSPRPAILQKAATAPLAWYSSQPAMQVIELKQALQTSRGKGVVIADINALVDYSHPALIGHLTGGFDFVLNSVTGAFPATLNQSSSSFLDQSNPANADSATQLFLNQSSSSFLDQSSSSFLDTNSPAHGHGTLCAGILAMVAPDAMIMPLRAFDNQGNSDLFTITKAVYYAVDHGANVINMSFGTLQDNQSFRKMLSYASAHGVTLVASAGNANSSVLQYPAGYSTSVIQVAATDNNDIKASFSNFNSSVYVSAPGVNIISTYPGGYYAMASGTSFSAPMVAAQAALVRSAFNTANPWTYIGITDSIDSKNPSYKRLLGIGRIDLPLSLNLK